MATIQPQDVLPVRSRVSWGAILAGAFVTLAVSWLLGALGLALGLSVRPRVSERELGIGAAIWAVVTVLLALFVGGCVTSRCTAGENKGEAVIYGVIMWGVVLALLLWQTVSGIHMGFTGLIAVSSAAGNTAAVHSFSDEDLRAAGFSDEQIQNMHAQFDRLRGHNVGTEVRSLANDPRAAAAAWWTFAGILLSMLAAIAGALAGSGPELFLRRLTPRSATVRTGEPLPR